MSCRSSCTLRICFFFWDAKRVDRKHIVLFNAPSRHSKLFKMQYHFIWK